MTIPSWITDTGSLGTIEENLYFEYQLSATGSNLKYRLQAGHFPPGILITEDGLIKGTPYMVNETVMSTFVIRAYDSINEEDLFDRTFSLTVVGADTPFFITTDTTIVTEYSGVKISYQIEYSDPDITQALTIRKSAGDLPPGLTIDDKGLISGIVPLLPGYTGQLPEPYDDGTGYDMRGYDLDAIDPGYNYADFNFTLEISDGTNTAYKSFIIRIKEPPLLLPPIIMQDAGSIGTYRHDNYFEYSFEYYDVFAEGVTWSLVTTTSYGYDSTLYDESFYDSTAYEAYPFHIDPESGVLYGKIPVLVEEQKTYTFIVRATKANTAYTQKVFTVTFLGDKNKDLIWLTNTYLGELNTGDYSYFHIRTENSSNLPIVYKYQTGNLPEGLTVMPSGAISGRVKFGGYLLDDGQTMIDNETTVFDSLHTFTVRAFSEDDYITNTETTTTYVTQNFTGDGITKTFQLVNPTIIDNLIVTVNGVYKTAQDIKNDIFGDFKLSVNQITFFTAPTAGHSIIVSIPTTTTTTTKTYLIDETKDYQILINNPYVDEYTNIYCEALIKPSQRTKWYSILNDTKIFPIDSLYYPDDATYALPRKANFLLLAGIELKTAYDFLSLMQHNFYKKTVIIGEPKSVTAYDQITKQAVYEVIYLPVYDNLENSQGDSVGNALDLQSLITHYTSGTIAYPNSFENMQNNISEIMDSFTYVTNTSFAAFPLWMKPLYPNLLNNKNPREVYKRAIPIAYVKVGESNRILFNLRRKKIDFKQFSFEIQRLTVDNNKGTTLDLDTTTLNVMAHTEFDNHTTLLPNSLTEYGTPWVLDQTSPQRTETTTFDSLGTRFIHEEVTLDKGEPPYKYIRFPDTNIFD